MAKNLNPSWPLWAIGICSGLVGIMIGVASMTGYHAAMMADFGQRTEATRSRMALLEAALGQASPGTQRLDTYSPPAPTMAAAPQAPAPQMTAKPPVQTHQQPAPSVTPQAAAPIAATQAKPPAVAPTVTLPKPAQPPAQVKPAPTPPQQPPQPSKPVPAPAQPAVQAKPIAAPAQPAPAVPQGETSPVTADEIKRAMANNRIEGISSEKANIVKLSQDVIEFKSGRKVRKGEKFPSGEKLLGVDPTSGRIITDQRQLLILDLQ